MDAPGCESERATQQYGTVVCHQSVKRRTHATWQRSGLSFSLSTPKATSLGAALGMQDKDYLGTEHTGLDRVCTLADRACDDAEMPRPGDPKDTGRQGYPAC